ncbi:MAG: M23 family metallopeptidase [bacterium]|nr:M23 family metallopeptidase [bacterium]
MPRCLERLSRCFVLLFPFVIGLLPAVAPLPITAQSQCDPVSSIRFPVDTAAFRLVQDFGAPSPRHQGRYHTGEDWYGGRGTALGQPVQAIANGRVTFSSPNGWGRDGGVIILEHRFPDGSVAYSQYGHIMETDAIRFPPALACVREGDIIAAVGDSRPAPHLHFEIRTENPDTPGAGYTWHVPTQSGLRRPSKFILNWQMWLSPAHAWHVDLADESGPAGVIPLPLPSGLVDLVVLDADRVLRVSADGRVLWRVNLDRPAVGLDILPDTFRGGVRVIFADGGVREIDPDANIIGAWETGVALASPPMRFGTMAASPVVFHTPDQALVAFDSALRTVLWRIENAAPVLRYAANDTLFSAITSENTLITLDSAGTVIDRAFLRDSGALWANDTDMFAYTQGGFWRIDAAGTWSLVIADAPPGGESAAFARSPADDGWFLFDGAALYAYAADGVRRWQLDLPGIQGETRLHLDSLRPIVTLTSSYGTILSVRTTDGVFCNGGRIFGDRRSRLWSRFAGDTLVTYTADQIIGLRLYPDFLMGCAG